jgi:enoyl-CoA hydratase
MEMTYVLYQRKDLIGVLTVNRPKALNALNSDLLAELGSALDEISNSDIRALVITGAGDKAFVAGADIAEMKDFSSEQALAFSIAGNKVLKKVENLPMPSIAAVGGFCLGGGFELALACDIIMASENAVFGLPETTLGILPGYGGIQMLARAIGLAKAKELVFTGRKVKAAEALALGLASKVVEPETLAGEAEALAGRIAAAAPVAVRAAKKVANNSVGLTLEQMTNLESESFSACFDTADQKMAMTAFLSKSNPEPFAGK